MTADARLHIESLRAVMAAARPGTAMHVFRLMATEAARLIDTGDVAKADMVDALAEVGREARIGSDDEITAAIAYGMEHPHEPPPSVVPAGLIAVRASEIIPEPIQWLWPGRFAIGKLCIIAGDPSLGKSQLTLNMVAAVTRGGQWPNGEGRAEKGSAIVLSVEDDPKDTVRPRLDAAGADPTRVHLVFASERTPGKRTPIDLQRDLDLIEMLIQNIGDVRLVVIDPITAYLGKVDSHKNAELRAVLAPLSEMAARLRVAVVAVTHLTKSGAGTGAPANTRIIGSIAFVAGPRQVFLVAMDPQDPEPDENRKRRLFLQTKNTNRKVASGLAFRIVDRATPGGISASAIEWEAGTVALSANQALAASETVTVAAPQRQGAEAFLRELLRDGPKAATEIEVEAAAAGFAFRTVRRAKDNIGVDVAKIGIQGEWFWSLPKYGP